MSVIISHVFEARSDIHAIYLPTENLRRRWQFLLHIASAMQLSVREIILSICVEKISIIILP